jgi:hypothetical protein
MFGGIGLCVGLKIILWGQWDCRIYWSEFVFLVILSELMVQYVKAISRQGSCTLLVHFVRLIDCAKFTSKADLALEADSV